MESEWELTTAAQQRGVPSAGESTPCALAPSVTVRFSNILLEPRTWPASTKPSLSVDTPVTV